MDLFIVSLVFVIKRYQIYLKRQPEGCAANAIKRPFLHIQAVDHRLVDTQCLACVGPLLVLHLKRDARALPWPAGPLGCV